MTTAIIVFCAMLGLWLCGYLASCAGAGRWLTLREWWGGEA